MLPFRDTGYIKESHSPSTAAIKRSTRAMITKIDMATPFLLAKLLISKHPKCVAEKKQKILQRVINQIYCP